MQIKFFTIATIAACIATLTQASPITTQNNKDVVATPDSFEATIQQIRSNPAVLTTLEYLLRLVVDAIQHPAIPTTPAKDPTTSTGTATPAPMKDTNAKGDTKDTATPAPVKNDDTKAATPAPAKDAVANPHIGGQPIVGKTAPLNQGATEAAKEDEATDKDQKSEEEPKKDAEEAEKDQDAEEPKTDAETPAKADD